MNQKVVRVKSREAVLAKGEALTGDMLVAQVLYRGRELWTLTLSAIKGDIVRTLTISKTEWIALRKLVEGR